MLRLRWQLWCAGVALCELVERLTRGRTNICQLTQGYSHLIYSTQPPLGVPTAWWDKWGEPGEPLGEDDALAEG